MYLHGSKDTTFDLADHLDDRKSTFFLYPDSEGIFIDDIDWRKFENGVNLIVPDGNWRQTSKMKKRIKGLENFPTIQFRSLPESMYRIRAERKSNGLATLEAIALALGYIEGPHVQTSLLDLLHIQTTRILQSRGQRPTDLT